MKQEKIVLCIAEGETLEEFTGKVAELSCNGSHPQTVIAKFEGKVLYVSPFSSPGDIKNQFEWLGYNKNGMSVATNL